MNQSSPNRFAVIFLIDGIAVPYYRETFASPEEAYDIATEYGKPGSILATVTEEGSTLDRQLSALIAEGNPEKNSA